MPNLVIKQIRKRDDRIEDFNLSKVTSAIFKAAYSVGGTNLEQARELALLVQEKINSSFKEGEIPSVEQVQDIIESVLIKAGKDSTAKAYILFRNERNRAREKRTDLMLTVKDLVFKDSGDLDLKRENGNIDGNSTMGTMLRCGGETSKIFHKSFLMSYEYALAHDRGDIHIHDLDFGSLCLNCCQIDASKLLHYGFDNGSGFIRPPSNIRSAASLICIIIQSNQNDMFGGQSIPKFDYNLAPFVAKTFIKKLIDVCSIKYEDSFTNVQINDIKSVCKKHYDKHHTLINTNTWVLEKNNVFGDVLSVITDYKYKEFDIVDAEDHKTINSIFSMALKRTEDEVYQAMEAVVHNLNTMHSRAGAQVPFSSINYGTDTSAEGRMVIKNILLALDAGMGNGETPIFPIHIFKVKDGINGNPGDPNYDLYELSVEVSAKRLFPNWVFIDAPFNLKYYKPGDPDTEAATMGCVDGQEIITYKYNGNLYVESFERGWKFLTSKFEVKTRGKSQYCDLKNVTIYDSHSGKFVECRKIICNPDKGDWTRVTFNNGRTLLATSDHPLPVENKGRTFVRDLNIGDKVPAVWDQYAQDVKYVDPEIAWALGLIICDGAYNSSLAVCVGLDEEDIADKYISVVKNKFGFDLHKIYQNRGIKGNYLQISLVPGQSSREFKQKLFRTFGGWNKIERRLPKSLFSWNRESRLSFLAGMIDADGHIHKVKSRISLGSTNKELALEQLLLVQSLGYSAKCYLNHYRGSHDKKNIRYKIEFPFTKEIKDVLASSKKKIRVNTCPNFITPTHVEVSSIEVLGNLNKFSYDVETESDYFDVSGIISHNCRTRVVGNIHDPSKEIFTGRGNLSFTSINLPRLAIENKGNIDAFFVALKNRVNLVFGQLLERFEYQAMRKVLNFPFLMGEGIWMDSEKLDYNDSIKEVMKHGTLGVGFIGLAECLVALIGKHHGESKEAQELGLKIVRTMREMCDEQSKETKLNFSLIGSPAEGLSGRFLRIDRKLYGVIPGVTDREYYTNSNHIPVYYPISVVNKIKLEAPYHEYENGGHITYVEVDGDPTNNVSAMMDIVQYMKKSGVGYGSINHPVDRDPVCGYTGVINDVCPRCGRRDGEAVSIEVLKKVSKYASRNLPSDEELSEKLDTVPNADISSLGKWW